MLRGRASPTAEHNISGPWDEKNLIECEYTREEAGVELPELKKVADAKKLEEEIASSANELELLIDIVSNLNRILLPLVVEEDTQSTSSKPKPAGKKKK